MDFSKIADSLDVLAVAITMIPLGVGFALLLVGALLPEIEQKNAIKGMGLLAITGSFFPTLCIIVFGAKGLLVIPLLALSMVMAYQSLGEEGHLTLTLKRLKLSFVKLPPPEEDVPESGGKVLRFERQPRRTGPRPL